MATLTEVRSLISLRLDVLATHPGFLGARPGFQFVGGTPTSTPAVIVLTRDTTSTPPGFPPSLDGVPIDVVQVPAVHLVGAATESMATPEEAAALAAAMPPVEIEALSPYNPPPQLSQRLNQTTTAKMTVTCHVSPDAGWPTLKSFLKGAKKSLTIAMYDLTAPHVVDALVAAKANLSESFRLILDPKISLDDGVKAHDLQETIVRDHLEQAGGPKMDFTWAAISAKGKTTGGIFPTAYHIKVAVRDHKAFWLSSGNMQSSNQPDLPQLTPANAPPNVSNDFNREWHVVVEHEDLADLYERFIKFDIEEARPLQATADASGVREAGSLTLPMAAPLAAPKFFAPITISRKVTVQPLLTPDNYVDHVLPVIRDAEKTIDFQNQYIHLPKNPTGPILRLLQALLRKQNEGITLRIILRDIGDTRTMLEMLVGFGFKPDSIKLQRGCHTKGIVVDRKVVVIGSHNYSSQGVAENRDASLIFFDQEIAEYYADVFDHDWNDLATAASLSALTTVNALAAAAPGDFDMEEDGGPTA